MGQPYNVNLETNTCFEERLIEKDLLVEEFISRLRESAKGLEDPTVGVDYDVYYDSADVRIVVSGKRQLTEPERLKHIADQDRARRYREHIASFLP